MKNSVVGELLQFWLREYGVDPGVMSRGRYRTKLAECLQVKMQESIRFTANSAMPSRVRFLAISSQCHRFRHVFFENLLMPTNKTPGLACHLKFEI